jgi:glycerol-3-phosphate dehydrogenase
VRDALKERALLIRLAPHLARPLPILTPLYTLLEIPYLMTGLKLYDLLAGRQNLAPSRFVTARDSSDRFPMLRRQGLRGAVLYHDGQFDDARMNVALALTAAREDAVLANHVAVTGLLKSKGRIAGASVRDQITREEWEIEARVVINATGPFADEIRRMDEPRTPPLLSASSGIHIVLPGEISPAETGLLIPRTEDGRVLFILPWLGYTLIGTTDNPALIEPDPQPAEAEVEYLLRHVTRYFDLPVSRDDVLAQWSGLRPLVSDPKAADTARLSRDHVINTSAAGLLTIAGGKWTTYRKMALDTVDAAVRLGGLSPSGPSGTEATALVGGAAFDPLGSTRLVEDYQLGADSAKHLHHSYGDQAREVLDSYPSHARLLPDHPYLEAEVVHGARREGARTALDILARRVRLAFVDQRAAITAVSKVVELLASTLGWSETQARADAENSYRQLGKAGPRDGGRVEPQAGRPGGG